jgi:hypothetical protein
MNKVRVAFTFAVLGLITVQLAACGGSSYGGDGDSQPPATLSIAIDPGTITLGESATITWNSNGNACTASGDWTGNKAADGNEDVSPATAGDYTYSLVCRGGGYGESERGSVNLSVEPVTAAGLWSGEACCVDSNAVGVTGMTTDAGEFRFLFAGRHFIKQRGVATVAYASCADCLAGDELTDWPAVDRLTVTRQSSQPAPLEGSYTTQLGSGYTLTLSVDATGEVIGSDTNGCRLNGRATRARATDKAYTVDLAVNGCGQRDGRYRGYAASFAGDSGQAPELFLSAASDDAAIGWRLVR